MAGEALFGLVLLAGLVVPFVLWALVQQEREDREPMDREAAERAARRDTSEDSDDEW